MDGTGYTADMVDVKCVCDHVQGMIADVLREIHGNSLPRWPNHWGQVRGTNVPRATDGVIQYDLHGLDPDG